MQLTPHVLHYTRGVDVAILTSSPWRGRMYLTVIFPNVFRGPVCRVNGVFQLGLELATQGSEHDPVVPVRRQSSTVHFPPPITPGQHRVIHVGWYETKYHQHYPEFPDDNTAAGPARESVPEDAGADADSPSAGIRDSVGDILFRTTRHESQE
jgi:hypothetical protein